MKTSHEQLAEEARSAGLLTGQDIEGQILQWAKENPQSAWYAHLEWDNEKCGDLWRRQQIHQVVIHIKIVEPEGPNTIEFREFTSVPVDGTKKQLLVPTVDVLADPVARKNLIVRILTNAYGEARNYPQLHELDKWRKITSDLIDKYRVE